MSTASRFRGFVSNDWADVISILVEGLSLRAASGVHTLFSIYLIIGLIMFIFTLWTALQQFIAVLRPCLPHAVEHGYSTDRNGKHGYRIRWPILSLFAMLVFLFEILCGVASTVLWPLWLPCFFLMVAWDRISHGLRWFAGSSDEDTFGVPVSDIDHIHIDPSARPNSRSVRRKRGKWRCCGLCSLLGSIVLWPFLTMAAFAMDICNQLASPAAAALWRKLGIPSMFHRTNTPVKHQHRQRTNGTRHNYRACYRPNRSRGTSPVPKDPDMDQVG